MRNRIGWLFALVLCGGWELAASTAETPQDQQGAFIVVRPATAIEGGERIAEDHRPQYHVNFRDGGVYVFPSAADFSHGSVWRWGVRLTGYGTPNNIQAVDDPKIVFSGKRLEFRRGPITEWYENMPAGLEQGFTLHEAPAPEATEVVLHLAIEGGLHGKWEKPDQSIDFLTESGASALRYGDLKVTDADGTALPARLALAPGRMGIHVDVGAAKWPILVDPIIDAPGEALLDWIEVDFVLSDTTWSVEIPVRWSRFYGEPALIARYWLDDKLVMTRAVDDGDTQSGKAKLVIEEGGEHELTVELCNTEGCSDSEPLLLNVFDPEQAFGTAADASGDEDMLSYQEASQIVHETAARLASDPQRPPTITDPAAVGWGAWWAGFVGQTVVAAGLGLGFDALILALGSRPDTVDLAAKLDGINQSLGEIKIQLDEISRKIDVGKADSDFRNSHRLAAIAMQNFQDTANQIAEAEAGTGAPPTQGMLETWADDNSDNIGALKTLLVDPLTGAVPLLLRYYQLKYPVSSGIEVRTEIEGYVNGFRAALGVALINQAWLSKAHAPNAVYDKGAESNARAIVVKAYDLTGAPYPQPPNGLSRFIHRIGTGWALIDEARPLLPGENARVMTQNWATVWSYYNHFTALGVNAPGGLTIMDYMAENHVKNLFNDPNSVRIEWRDSFFECEVWVKYNSLYIWKNSLESGNETTYNQKYACIGGGKVKRKAREEEARLKSTFGAHEKIYTVDVEKKMNAWGMPALMDKESIRGWRDGIDTSVTRGEGNAITVAYDPQDYDWLQLHDPETGAFIQGSGTLQPKVFPNIPAPTGAVEIRLGYNFGGPDDGDMIVRERTILLANPDLTNMSLTLDPIRNAEE